MFSNFFNNFLALFLGLATIKAFLVVYRIRGKKWPADARFLWEIIEWDREIKKIAFLGALAFLLTFVQSFF